MHVALSQCCTRHCFRSTHLAQNQSQRGSAVHHLARAAQRYPPGVSDVGEALLRGAEARVCVHDVYTHQHNSTPDARPIPTLSARRCTVKNMCHNLVFRTTQHPS